MQREEAEMETHQQYEQQSLAEIGRILRQAQLKNTAIHLQRATKDREQHIAVDISGHLTGYTATGIVIDDTQIEYDDIWHVDLVA